MNELLALRDARHAALSRYFRSIEEDLALLATNRQVIDAMVDFRRAFGKLNMAQRVGEENLLRQVYSPITPAGQIKSDVEKQSKLVSSYFFAHNQHHPWFGAITTLKGYYDLFLISPTGDVIYSMFKEQDFATNLLQGEWRETGLAEAFKLLFIVFCVSAVSISSLIAGSPQAYLPELLGAALFLALVSYAISTAFTRKKRRIWRSTIALCMTIVLFWFSNLTEVISGLEVQSARTELASVSSLQDLRNKSEASKNRYVTFLHLALELGRDAEKEIEEIITDIRPHGFDPNLNLHNASDKEAKLHLSRLREASLNATIAKDQIKVLLNRLEKKFKDLLIKTNLSEKLSHRGLESFRLSKSNKLIAYNELLDVVSERFSIMAEVASFRFRERNNYIVRTDGRLIIPDKSKLAVYQGIVKRLKQNGTRFQAAQAELEAQAKEFRERTNRALSTKLPE